MQLIVNILLCYINIIIFEVITIKSISIANLPILSLWRMLRLMLRRPSKLPRCVPMRHRRKKQASYRSCCTFFFHLHYITRAYDVSRNPSQNLRYAHSAGFGFMQELQNNVKMKTPPYIMDFWVGQFRGYLYIIRRLRQAKNCTFCEKIVF